MSDSKELAYALIAKYGKQWLKEDSQSIYEMQKEIKKFPKEMRKPYEEAIEADKKFLFRVAAILEEQENSITPDNNQNKKLATVKQIPKLYPGVFTESSIRWLIFNEKQNGFSCCIHRVGKKVLIDLDSFEKWIKQQ